MCKCAITCDALRDLARFVQFRKRENIHGGVLLASACKVTKGSTPPWVIFMFFEL